VFFLVGAGLVAGLDGVLKDRLPRWLTGADGVDTPPSAGAAEPAASPAAADGLARA
jgi:hypothetical protein